MYNPNFLTLSRYHIYYFRFPVPSRFHPQGKRTDIKLSLDTRCPREALQLSHALTYVGQQFLKHPMTRTMDYQELRETLHGHFHEMRERTKERILSQGMLPLAEVKALQNNQAAAMHALSQNDFSTTGNDSEIGELIEEYALPIRRESADYTTLQTEFVKAFRDYCGSVLEYNSRFDEFNFKTDPAGLQRQQAYRKANKHKLVDAIAQYTQERLETQKWSAATAQSNRAKFQLLAKYLGEDAPLTMSSDIASDVKRMLYKLPARYNLIPKLQSMSIDEMLEQTGYEKIKAPTVAQYLTTYSSLYEWAVKRKLTDENNFLPLIDDVEKARIEREPFTLEQSKVIIARVAHEKKTYRKWGTLIAFYTGARVNEICQLHGEDISQEGDVWLFDINKNGANKRLKNKASKRIIPIHSQLIDLGLLDFVKNAGKGHLFPSLPYQEKGGYGRNLSRWFNDTLLDELGMNKPSLVFHSIRHTVAQQLRDNGVELSKNQSIMGHAQAGEIVNRYAKNVRAKILLEAIETLKYA